jgi:hypothetical protein
MARKLTKLKITEVSSCDRAANPGARVVLMKRDPVAAVLPRPEDRYAKPRGRMNIWELQEEARRGTKQEKKLVKNLVDIAKRVVAGERIVAHTKDDYYKALEKGGAAIRKHDPALTEAQGFAKFAESEDGKLLMKAMKLASLPPMANGASREPMMSIAPIDATSAYEAMMRQARELMRRTPGMTEARAFAEVYSDPQNENLRAADKEHHFRRMIAGNPAALPPPAGSTGPGLRPDQEPSFRKLLKRARRLQKKHPGLSEAQAFEKVYVELPGTRELVAKYRQDFAQRYTVRAA